MLFGGGPVRATTCAGLCALNGHLSNIPVISGGAMDIDFAIVHTGIDRTCGKRQSVWARSGYILNQMLAVVYFAMKRFLKTVLFVPVQSLAFMYRAYEALLSTMFNRPFAYQMRGILTSFLDNETRVVRQRSQRDGVELTLHTPNHICAFRQETFSSKEPEMIEWIDKYGDAGVLYDIGANVGLYSLYFAKTQNAHVYSFEPSVFNLKQLAKNISANGLSDSITVVPNPLTAQTGSARFINSDTHEGGALNAFGVNYGHDCTPIHSDVSYNTMGFALDDLLAWGVVAHAPALIKIDVDGIEHLILSGARKTLASDTCRSVYIEVNEDFAEQATQVSQLLQEAGFEFVEKRHADLFEGNQQFGRTFNQIWIKP